MNFQNIRCLLIDLDDTLYPHNNGTWQMIRKRINQFMLEEMHFSQEEIPSLRQRLWQQYGTTLRGLQAEFTVDMDAYLDYVHDVPLETMIAPNPELAQLLRDLPQRKVVFTNAHAVHAQRVLDIMEIGEHFTGIIDVYAMSPYCKPEIEAFHKALSMIEEAAEHCLLIDDSPDNLDTAQKLGMQTISVGLRRHNGSPHIDTIQELGELVNG